MSYFYCLCVLIVLALSACSSLPPKPEVPQKPVRDDFTYATNFIDYTVQEAMNKYHIKGLSIAVVVDDRIIYQGGYGYADSERRSAVTPDTYFRIASITKSMTAIAIMQLVEKGKIDLDAPISQYIKEFSIQSREKNPKPITVRHLLTHRSGLMMEYLCGTAGEAALNDSELLAALKKEYVYFPAGWAYKYSNLGYGLLGIIIGRVSGLKYEDYIVENIFKPLGMSNTYSVSNRGVYEHLAQGYDNVVTGMGEDRAVPTVDIRDKSAGNVYSTAHDMTRYLRFWTTGYGKLLQQKSLSEMTKEHFTEPNYIANKNTYGFGICLNQYHFKDEGPVYGHTGYIPGYFTEFCVVPNRGIGIVILGVSSGADSGKRYIVSKILPVLLEARKAQPVEVLNGINTNITKVDADSFDRLTGIYAGFPIMLEVEKRQNELFAKILNFEAKLEPVGRDLFRPAINILFFKLNLASFLGADDLLLQFITNKEGKAYCNRIAYIGNMYSEVYLEKASQHPYPATYSNYIGFWDIVPDPRYDFLFGNVLPKDVSLEFKLREDGWVCLVMGGRGWLLLKPQDETMATIWGFGDTVYFKGDTIEYSGMRWSKKKR